MDAPILFNTHEAAATLGVNERTIARWVKAGRIKPARTAGNGYLFSGAEINRVAQLPKRRRGPARKPKQNARLPLDGVA